MMKKKCLQHLSVLLFVTLSLSSCVQGDLFDDIYGDDYSTCISRKKSSKDTSTPVYYFNGDNANYFQISDHLFSSSGCVLDALNYVCDGIRKNYIKSKMKEFDNDVNNFPAEKVDDVLESMKNDTSCPKNISYTYVSVGELQTGDIAFTHSPLTLTIQTGTNSSTTRETDTGHCFVIDDIVSVNNQKRYSGVDIYYFCCFDQSYLQGGYRISVSNK